MTGVWGAAWRNVVRRWRRNVLSGLAIAVGSFSVVSVIAFTFSSAERTASTISVYEATTVTATLPNETWSLPESELAQRAEALGDVVAAGTMSVSDSTAVAVDLANPLLPETVSSVRLVVASADGLRARGASLVAGGLPQGVVAEHLPTAIVVGDALARELGVTTAPGSNSVNFVGGVATVVGVVRDEGVNSALNTSVVVTPEAAVRLGYTAAMSRTFVIRTSSPAGDISAAVANALLPESPGAVTIAIPPSPSALKDQLVADSQVLVLVVSSVMILAGALGVVSTMQIAVWERRREIGLTRALGASRWAVTRGFLLEAVAVGLVGGAVGWCAGVLALGALTLVNGWPLTMPPALLLVPLAGGVVGAVSGAAPAASASRIDPVELLRS